MQIDIFEWFCADLAKNVKSAQDLPQTEIKSKMLFYNLQYF
jgi:hypothetical protein